MGFSPEIASTASYLKSIAVWTKNVWKSYGDNKILQNFCMSVERKSIYALLGPSGCGKTTVLSTIVGLQRVDSGDIVVFGRPPGKMRKRLGYVPQETALYNQLSIQEMFEFYGRMNNMTSEEIEDKLHYLIELLDLTSAFKLIGDLSGGQKRRISLAIALMHCSNGLLILDEPTVGLDPLLRRSVWNHLTNIVKDSNTTVILTTHYTEEARLSDMIGVMRGGRLIVEDTPSNLLTRNRTNILEEVVLQLCYTDQNDKKPTEITRSFDSGRRSKHISKRDVSTLITVGVFRKIDEYEYNLNHSSTHCEDDTISNAATSLFSKLRNSSAFQSLHRILGLTTVILLTFVRHPIFISLILLFPTIHGSITLATIGTKPKGMKFGVVNKELLNWTMECDMPKHLSCYFLNELNHDSLLTLISYLDEEHALEAVHLGRSWGYMVIEENYTQHIFELAVAKRFATNESLEGSKIHVRIDYSQYVGSLFIVKELYSGLQAYVRTLFSLFQIERNKAEIVPFHFRPPVYGNYEDTFTECLIPGVIICCLFGILAVLTSVVFINDQKQGTLRRAQVAGLQTSELMISHIITQGLVTLVQLFLLTIVFYLFFGFTILGSLGLYVFICLISGLCGTALGILLGIVCDNEVESMIFMVFSSPVLLIYGGVFWSLESMPVFWKRFGYILPTTLPIVSLRTVITRGLPLTHEMVFPGIAVSFGWTLLFLILAFVIFRKHTK